MGRQFRLDLQRPPAFTREAFVVSTPNREAVASLETYPQWPAPVLALVGPEGTGKTHLANVWAERNRAVFLTDAAADLADLPSLEGRPVVVDDADQAGDETLFHLINQAGVRGGGLLLTSRVTPSLWACALPDLRSRLNAVRVAEIDEPDDAVLRGVLVHWFRRLLVDPSPELLDYLILRMERSAAEARVLVSRLVDQAVARRRPVTRSLAREVLEAEPAD